MAIRLPSTLIGTFIDQEDSICAYRADELLQKRTMVDVNDDVPSVSRSRSSYRSRSTSSSSRSKSSNNSSSKKSKNSKKGKKGKESDKKKDKSVTIKSGDTLSEIAARNGTTVKKLRKLNGISGNNIRAGKKLKVK